jgi:CRP-like cAMP-binding protein
MEPTHIANKLLRSLPPVDLERISPHLVALSLPARKTLYKEGDSIGEVYFLGAGACSLLKTMSDGAAIEIATVGNEGVIGWSVYLGEHRSPSQVVMEMACPTGLRMRVDAFITEMECRGAFYKNVVRYSQASMSQLMVMTACNALHSVHQRCARRLLMVADRGGSNDVPVTHELMAHLLGVRRPTITEILRDMQKKGVVETRRGMVRIHDRRRLEELSCECYATVNGLFNRLVPDIPPTGYLAPRTRDLRQGLSA